MRVNSQLLLGGRQIRSDEEMLSLYRRRLVTLGFSATAMFYRSAQQHEDKLRCIGQVLQSAAARGDVIIDAGCGYGELLNYLPGCRYVGIDLCDEMILEARRRHPGRSFRKVDLREVEARAYDWVVLAGVVNSVVDPESLVRSGWEACRKGMLVDVVDSGRVPAEYMELNRFAIDDVLARLHSWGARSASVVSRKSIWDLVLALRGVSGHDPCRSEIKLRLPTPAISDRDLRRVP